MVVLIVLSTIVALAASYIVWSYLTDPLRAFPSAHWSSSISNWWRVFDVLSRKCQLTSINLHEKHGSAVRMGPNIVSISDPVALKDVFRTQKPWLTSAA